MHRYRITLVNDESSETLKIDSFSMEEAIQEAIEICLLDDITQVLCQEIGIVLADEEPFIKERVLGYKL